MERGQDMGETEMKRMLMLILFLLVSSTAIAQTTYYVSSSGNDANNGTSPATPWKEPNRIASATMYPGDMLLFKRGDKFEGAFSRVFQGTPSNPIIIGAYGTGPDPILYGDLRGRVWTPVPNHPGVYRTSLGGYGEIFTGFWQKLKDSTTWTRSLSDGYFRFRSSAPSEWEAWFSQLIPGAIGHDVWNDSLFVYPYGGVMPSSDSMKIYRFGNNVQAGSHDVIIQDLEVNNYYEPITINSSQRVTVRNVHMVNGHSSGIRFNASHYGRLEHCIVDSSGDSGIYLVNAHMNVVEHNLVTNVLPTIDGGIESGVDLCGIGILGNYSWGRARDTIGYNVIQYNTFENIYSGFTDFYFNQGDTVRFNIGHNGGSSGAPHGTNIVMMYNRFTMRPGFGGNGANIGNLGPGNITFAHNTLDSVRDYGVWTSQSDIGQIRLNNNFIRLNAIGYRVYVDYKTIASSVVSDSNRFFGTANVFVNNGTYYSTIPAIYAANGKEQHSTINDESIWIPSPISPSNGSNTNETLTLTWDGTPGANTYQVQISTTPTFTNIVYDDSTWAEYKTVTLPPLTYYWRLRTTAAIGGQSNWSSVWSFMNQPAINREIHAPVGTIIWK